MFGVMLWRFKCAVGTVLIKKIVRKVGVKERARTRRNRVPLMFNVIGMFVVLPNGGARVRRQTGWSERSLVRLGLAADGGVALEIIDGLEINRYGVEKGGGLHCEEGRLKESPKINSGNSSGGEGA